MIAVLISEFRDWFRNYRRHTLLPLMPVMAVAAVAGIMRPETCLIIFLAYCVFIGHAGGKEAWNKVNIEGWVVRTGLGFPSVISGKLMGIFCIGVVHAILLAPVWISISLLWGIPFYTVLVLLFNCVLVICISACLSIIGIRLAPRKHYFGQRVESDTIIAKFLIGFWLVITAAVPVLRISSPLLIIYKISINYEFTKITIGILTDLGLLIIISAVSFLLFKKFKSIPVFPDMENSDNSQ